jgi:hypothetical protein
MNRTTANLLVLSGIFGAGAVTAMACGGGPAEAPQSPANASAAPAASGAPATGDSSSASASAAASAAPSPLASVLITDSGTVQKLFDAANTAPAATLKAGGATGADPLAKGVRENAKAGAPGMDPDGPLALGSLKEKQHLQTDVTLKPGKCYAVVGYSPKIKDLDLHLFLPPGILSGQDTTDDNKPVIGRAPDWMCPGTSTAITYKVDIFADDGAGEIAVQLYSKGK